MNAYEIMFLFDPTAGANWDTVESEVNRIMGRAEAEVLVTKRLGERRLAYEIAGRKRGLYVLTFFKAGGDKIAGIERDARLSEMILRVLILCANDLSEEIMRNATLGVAQEAKPSSTEASTPFREEGVAQTKELPVDSSESAPDSKLVGSTVEDGESAQS